MKKINHFFFTNQPLYYLVGTSVGSSGSSVHHNEEYAYSIIKKSKRKKMNSSSENINNRFTGKRIKNYDFHKNSLKIK